MTDEKPDRSRTAERITRRIFDGVRKGEQHPGVRLSADGKAVIPCRRHWWDHRTERTDVCRHCGAMKLNGELVR